MLTKVSTRRFSPLRSEKRGLNRCYAEKTILMLSKRLIKFRNDLIKILPKTPNSKETKQYLEKESLSGLIFHYLSWLSRFVSIKQRTTIVEDEVTKDPRWERCKEGIKYLLNKVEKGENLTPHLSLKIHSKGFSLPYPNKHDRWEDKDFLLNAMGFHHFHLGTNIEEGGFITRTDEVLFAQVTHDLFKAVAIINHSVFESDDGQLTPERSRLWSIFDKYTTQGHEPGTVVLSTVITFSGHPIHIMSLTQSYSYIVTQIDPKLDDPEFVNSMFKDSSIAAPNKPKIEWMINASGLGIYERKTETFFILKTGFN